MAYGVYVDATVSQCLVDSNKVCNTTGGTGIIGDSDNNVFIKNIAYQNDTNYSSGVTNVFTEGLAVDPKLTDNISLLGSGSSISTKTISVAGVYTLHPTDILCDIVIDADDVCLDLQGYTLDVSGLDAITILGGHKNIEIKNGSIKGDGSSNGIVINDGCQAIVVHDIAIYSSVNAISFAGTSGNEIKACLIKDSKFHECVRGVQADFVIKSIFENCVAQNCVSAGFEQSNCQFNVFEKCKALKTGEGASSSDDVFGFSSSAGVGNLYTECVVEGTNKASSDVGADVFGFSLLLTETESKIINSIANSTSLVGSGTAYGIYLSDAVSSCLIESNKVCNTTGNATGVYGDSNNNIFIRNLAYNNDTNYSTNIINVFSQGLDFDPKLLDNISLPATTQGICTKIISTEGYHTLHPSDIFCGIVIDADNVTLDLQGYTLDVLGLDAITINSNHKNVTIKNGSIKSTSNGIVVAPGCEGINIHNIACNVTDNGIDFVGFLGNEIKSCSVKNCKFHECNKGVSATYLIKSVFENCQAQNCARGGFEIETSCFNVFDKCKALKTGESSSSSDDVFCFISSAGVGNLYTECVSEGANKTSSDVDANLYGFSLVEAEGESKIINSIANSTSLIGSATAYGIFLSPFELINSLDFSAFVYSVAWSPDGKYFAVGGGTPNNVRIFGLLSGTSVDQRNFGTSVRSVAWSPDGSYLAVGGQGPTDGTNEIQVYSFSSGLLSASPVDKRNFGFIIYSLAWSPDGNYLAVGGGTPDNGNEIQIYSFSSGSLSVNPVDEKNYGLAVLSVAWSPDGNYLAVAGSNPTVATDDLQIYSFSSGTLSVNPIEKKDFGFFINSVTWSPGGDYLAIGGGTPTDGTNELQIYSFSSGILSTDPVDKKDFGSFITSVAWSPDASYLAIGGRTPTDGVNELQIYGFSSGTLSISPIYERDYGFEINAIDWSSVGKRLVVGGGNPTDGDEIKIYGFTANCLIENNKVCNTMGNATGISGDSNDNVFIRNLAYNNDTNYSSAVKNVFISGLGVDPKILDNISLPASSGICTREIKIEGSYVLNERDVSCRLIIDADNVTLDLQGRTLEVSGFDAITINSGCKNVIIKNGSIKSTSNGIVIGSGCEGINVHDIACNVTDSGISFVGSSDSVIKACIVKDCKFHECHKGVSAAYLIKTIFDNCVAQNCVSAGFEIIDSQFNVFDTCKALKTGDNSLSSDSVVGFSSSAGTGNLYTECIAEGTNKVSSDIGADVFGLIFTSTEVESKVCNCVFNSTSLVGSATAYGIYVDDLVAKCLLDSNKVCNTTGNATGILGNSSNNVFIRNLAYENDANYSSEIINVFTGGLLTDPNLLDNISLDASTGSTLFIINSGVYTLADTNACCVVIDADDVTLDLNGCTLCCTTAASITILSGHKNIVIKNGAIRGITKTYDGIVVNQECEFIRIEDITIYACDNAISFNGSAGLEIKACSIVDCKFNSCNKGVFASYLKKSSFEHCSAKNCVQRGFEQIACSFNVYRNCNALDIDNADGTESAVGFNSLAGIGNVFKECFAEGIVQSDSSINWNTYAIGFNLGSSLVGTTTVFETESKIINCVVDSITSSDWGQAFGIRLEDQIDEVQAPTQGDTLSDAGSATDVAWSPQGRYIAYAKSSGYKIITFADFLFGGVVVDESSATTLSAVDWSADGQWLAAVALTGATQEIEVIKYDGSVGPVEFSNSDDISDVRWYHTSYNFAAMNATLKVIEKYSFDPDNNSISLIGTSGSAFTDFLDITQDDKFIVTARNNDTLINIFSGDSLVEVASDNVSNIIGIKQIELNPAFCCNDYYVAVVGVPGPDNLEVLKFDSQSEIWTSIDSVNFNSSIDLTSVKWSPCGKYLVVSGDPDDIGIYSFDPEAGLLTLVHTYDTDFTTDEMYVDWSPCGRYIVIHGNEGLEVIHVGDCVTRCVVQHNNIGCCTSDVCGMAIFGASCCNLIDVNTASCNGINYSVSVFNKSLNGFVESAGSLRNQQEPQVTFCCCN